MTACRTCRALEMQHDTTVYQVKLSGQATRVVASLLYLRYSKRRYLRFYRVVPSLRDEVLSARGPAVLGLRAPAVHHRQHEPGALARERPAGGDRAGDGLVRRSVMASSFVCHEIKHPNRKAGEERSFWTVETNFLPGRTFESLEDLNRQAFEWATVRMHHRPVARTGLIPAQAFEQERGYLTALHRELRLPMSPTNATRINTVMFRSKGTTTGSRERNGPRSSCCTTRIVCGCSSTGSCVAEYPLPPEGVKNQRISPEGQTVAAARTPSAEARFAAGRTAAAGPGSRGLGLSGLRLADTGNPASSVPARAVGLEPPCDRIGIRADCRRALRYRIVEFRTLHRIAWFCLSLGEERPFDVEVDESFRQRPAYQEGCLTDDPDLSALRPDDEPP